MPCLKSNDVCHGLMILNRGFLIKIAEVKWFVVLCVWFVMLSGCSRKESSLTADIGQHEQGKALLDLPKACEPIEPLLARCKSSISSEAEAKKLLSVLIEQLQTASEAEQLRICQDVQQFWQAACGVAQ